MEVYPGGMFPHERGSSVGPFTTPLVMRFEPEVLDRINLF